MFRTIESLRTYGRRLNLNMSTFHWDYKNCAVYTILGIIHEILWDFFSSLKIKNAQTDY